MAKPEQNLQKAILDYLRLKGYLAFKYQSAGIWQKDRQSYIPMPRRGIADIIGCSPAGRFVAIEVKILPRRPSPEQEAFLASVEQSGGLAILAYSLSDVTAQI